MTRNTLFLSLVDVFLVVVQLSTDFSFGLDPKKLRTSIGGQP
jgi:hypothetical protein